MAHKVEERTGIGPVYSRLQLDIWPSDSRSKVVGRKGLAPLMLVSQFGLKGRTIRFYRKRPMKVVRIVGIGPTRKPWQGFMLPLNIISAYWAAYGCRIPAPKNN